MKLHEYQAKVLLRSGGIPVPDGRHCFSVEEAVEIAHELGGECWVVKAQIHAGGRGKGGGVRVASSIDQVHSFAADILGMTLVTHQTGPEGRIVERLLIEKAVEIVNEFYVGVMIDRTSQQILLIGSSEGGMLIETVASEAPEKIHTIQIDPKAGLLKSDAQAFASEIDIPYVAKIESVQLFERLYQVFWQLDASLIEINPLVLTRDGQIVAIDAKINIDDNALFRHSELTVLRDLNEEDPNEIEASAVGLSYISLEGDIGCLVNGAGLAMATMDIIKLHGGEPANFLDVGGGATSEQVSAAFRIMLQNRKIRAILVNIFGGIMRCDIIAEGLVKAIQEIGIDVPLVVRLEGTNVERARKILATSDLDVIAATSMDDAARKVVAETMAQ